MSLPTEPTGPVSLRDLLLDNLIQGCSLDEVTDFCFRLGIDYENLPGATKAEKSRQLILFLERRNRIPELVLLGRRLRSDLKWELSAVAKPVVSSNDPVSPDFLVLEKPFHIELVRVPAGEFWMGSDPTQDEDAQSDELPKHRVYVSEFYIGKYLVTNAQYAAYAQMNGMAFKIPAGKRNHPVVVTSWDEVVAFCKRFSQMAGRMVRLPTEAEWEKADLPVGERVGSW